MRAPLRPMAGGVLALSLILSGAPARALDDQPNAQSAGVTQTPAPPETIPGAADPDTPASPEPSNFEDGGLYGDPDEQSSAPSIDPELPEPEVPGETLPPTTNPVDAQVRDPALDTKTRSNSKQSPVEGGAEKPEKPEAPEEIAVRGTLVVIADEIAADVPGPAHVDGTSDTLLNSERADEHSPEKVMVATDEGPIVTIDESILGEGAETGQRFEGEAQLSEASRDAVSAAIAAEGSLDTAETIDAAVAGAATAGEPLAVAGAITSLIMPGTQTQKKTHGADVLFYAGGGSPSDSQLKQLVADTSKYWASQTGGLVSSISATLKPRSTAFAKNREMRCSERNLDALWSHAAKQFGRTVNSYIGSGRHLVVLVDDDCGALSRGASGWASYGTLHSGGVVWVDLGARHTSAGSLPFTATTGVLAHEIGHNLGLAHGDSRVCTGTANDVQLASGAPAAPCRDTSYGDPFNVMGSGAWLGGRTPPALPATQKQALGGLSGSSVKTVGAHGGRSQTFTLVASGAPSGLRALKVATAAGGTFFVEYRSGKGQDAGMSLRAGTVYSTGVRGVAEYYTSAGVRVLKSSPARNANGTHKFGSTVISARDSQKGKVGLYQNVRAGKSLTPWNSNAKITVLSTSAASARVRVDYTPFVNVPYAHRMYASTAWMKQAKLTSGTDAGNGTRQYRLTGTVTRAELATYLYRLRAPKGYVAPKVSPFSDVKPGSSSYKEITWMRIAGIFKTGPSGSAKPAFRPAAPITRDALATYLFRLVQPKYAAPKKTPFSDVSTKRAHYREMAWAQGKSFLKASAQPEGKPKFSPTEKVSRSYIAVVLHRVGR